VRGASNTTAASHTSGTLAQAPILSAHHNTLAAAIICAQEKALAAQVADADLTTIAALSPANDDVIQRKSGSWMNRTIAQLKTDLAVNNVDNTSDANKPVSNAQQTALDLKANLAGGNAFTGAQTFAGNVGISTASPGAKLEIAAAASATNQALMIASSGTLANNDIIRAQINGLTNGFRMFQDASSNVVYSFEGGNVGIGTTGPLALLSLGTSSGTLPTNTKISVAGVGTMSATVPQARINLDVGGQSRFRWLHRTDKY